MTRKLKEFLGIGKKKASGTEFSAFFRDAKSRDKKKLLESVVREANKDQRDLVEKYKLVKTT
ncbi:MAG TPA: hypothetical protein VI953_03965 [Candidatus Paceibacterota bacterium]